MAKKINRDKPLPDSKDLFRRAGKMPISEAKARIAQYEKQTGKKWKGARNTGALRD